MASDLIAIARSGTRAARVALDLTAQNIANASSEGYVRRSVGLAEVASSSVMNRTDVALSGVRVAGIVRNADMFRQAEVRRTGADAARAGAELQGLENVEAAIEQTRVYESIVGYEAALQQLAADPTDPSLRTATTEAMATMARSFNIAASSLDAVGEGLRFEASDGIGQVNVLAKELARVNLRLARAADTSGDQTTLLDQRDSLLEKIGQFADLGTTFGSDGTVELRLGGASGPVLVTGGTASALASTTQANGTIVFDVGGTGFIPNSGTLSGKQMALIELADTRVRIDSLAAGIVGAANTAQGVGIDLDGNAGAAMMSGTGAADMKLAVTDWRKLATAPIGAGASSRNPANLEALRTTLASDDPAGAMNAILFDVSSMVAGRQVTRQALDSIASTARVALQAQAGVDLDQEAINLVRFQQAFQASGRVMQVANDLFDTLLGIH